MMGGMDWAALPAVADLLGIVDVEMLVRALLIIRDHQRGNA